MNNLTLAQINSCDERIMPHQLTRVEYIAMMSLFFIVIGLFNLNAS